MKKIFKRLKNNRLVYLGYFLKTTNRQKFWKDFRFVKGEFGYNPWFLFFDMIVSSLRIGSSFHEYYYYSFYKKNLAERTAFATMAYMYEYQLKNNPKPTRYYLEDKLVFLKEYASFSGRDWLNLNLINAKDVEIFIGKNEKAVLKNSKAGAGKKVEIIQLNGTTAEALLKYAREKSFDLLEEFVYQHHSLQKLSPNSLNTIRLITQINHLGGVEIIGSILRMGIDLNTDNLSTGGIACPIDPVSGIISGPAISFDNTKPDYESHPISGVKFEGFKIPYWKELITICKEAALLHPENKSIGWDVAVKNTGPILIEGNHDWGARLWQMPGKRGLKHIVEKYYH